MIVGEKNEEGVTATATVALKTRSTSRVMSQVLVKFPIMFVVNKDQEKLSN